MSCISILLTSNNSLKPLKQLWALVFRMSMIHIIQYMSETFDLNSFCNNMLS